MRIFLVQKMHSIKIPQCVFFSCKKCTRLKFAAKVLHFFQIHKKNHRIFYIFSNRVENIVIKARFGNHGIVESRWEWAIRLPCNGRKRNASLTTHALDKEDPDRIRSKGQTFEPEYNFLAARARLLQEIDEGGMSKCYLDAIDKTMPIANRRNAKKNTTRGIGYTRIETERAGRHL